MEYGLKLCYNCYDAMRHNNKFKSNGCWVYSDKEKNMDTNEKPVEEPVEEHESYPLVEATRKILLAAIGAVALGKDEVEDFINKLVERGELAEKDGRKLMNEVVDKRKKSARAAEEGAGKHVLDILDRLNVPTKKDMDDLNEKLAVLTKKVDELTKIKS